MIEKNAKHLWCQRKRERDYNDSHSSPSVAQLASISSPSTLPIPTHVPHPPHIPPNSSSRPVPTSVLISLSPVCITLRSHDIFLSHHVAKTHLSQCSIRFSLISTPPRLHPDVLITDFILFSNPPPHVHSTHMLNYGHVHHLHVALLNHSAH